MSGFDFKEIQEKISESFRPWQRSFQFWVQATNIYTGYKVSLLRYLFHTFSLVYSFSHFSLKILIWASSISGVSTSSEFSERYREARGNVGKTT